MAREYLGQVRDMGGAARVYKAAGAFEVDELEGTSGIRRRIFFEDIFLVTYHREVGTMFALVVGSLCVVLLFIILGMLADGVSNPSSSGLIVGGVVAFLSAPLFIVFLNRVIRKKDIITIFGRHGRARLEFEWRKSKARDIFQDACRVARNSRPAIRRARPQAPAAGPMPAPDEGPEPQTRS